MKIIWKGPGVVFAASVLAIALSSALVASAQIYKWIDSKGGLHVTSYPPTEENAKILGSTEEEDARRDAAQNAEIDKHRKFWQEQLSWTTGKCLQQETEALCNRTAEINRRKLKLIEQDPERYLRNAAKYGTGPVDFPE